MKKETIKSYVDYLVKTGQMPDISSRIRHVSKEDIAYLKDSKRHRNDPEAKKLTIKFWICVAMLLYLLYKYF